MAQPSTPGAPNTPGPANTDRFIRRVVEFTAAWGMTAFWRVRLDCGHTAKLPMADGEWMPRTFRVHCRSCVFRERAKHRAP